MKKIALLFPGQGSQYVGMGKALYENFSEAREIFEAANHGMGYNIQDKIFNGTEEELRQTAVTQPAIFTVSCAAFKVFSTRYSLLAARCSYVAGHSLGEYSALYASAVFDFQTGLKLVKYRGAFIQEACEQFPGTMAAVLGASRDDLKKICLEIAERNGCCEMVNFNAPGQIVVAGSAAAMAELVTKISSHSLAKGYEIAKAIPLNVSGAFHSSLMREAAQKMSEVLKVTELCDAKIPLVANVDAKPTASKMEIAKKLVEQIDHPVLWEDSVRQMISQGVEIFIELGPGKVLSGLLRKIDKSKKSYNVEDENSLNRTLEAVNVH